MIEEEDTEKIIRITYNSLDELFNREDAMLQTLQNYLNREDIYEFVESYITQSHNKSTLNLKIRLKQLI